MLKLMIGICSPQGFTASLEKIPWRCGRIRTGEHHLPDESGRETSKDFLQHAGFPLEF
jgi:hypothetical protein